MDAMKSSTSKKLTAPPAAGTGYVFRQQPAKNPNLPFETAWIKQGVDWNRYRTRYIAPVNTDYPMRANRWQESIRANQMQQDVQKMATSMRTQFIMAFQNDPLHHCLGVVMSPEKGSLTLAMAIMELVPGHVLLNAIKIAGPTARVLPPRPWRGARKRRARWPSRPGSKTPLPARQWPCLPTGHMPPHDPSISRALPGTATLKTLSSSGPNSS